MHMYYRNCRPDEKGQTCIREKQFHTFACDVRINYELQVYTFLYHFFQIALALDFLAENHYVHRDVAARNCLGMPTNA